MFHWPTSICVGNILERTQNFTEIQKKKKIHNVKYVL